MSDISEEHDRMIKYFSESCMEKLFYFCLRKTGSNEEAEDLTQDIALHIFSALNRGTVPKNFLAWVWQIARNRYSVWADKKHRHRMFVTDSDIGDYEIEDGNGSLTDDMITREQLSLLRRELAFIRNDYRDIIVAYYIENHSIREIAAAQSLTVSAVGQRLHRARIILKEGMDMAREFGKRSYNPEEISFEQNGLDGKKGQPWSILKHKLYKNIFLEAYENPETAEELSLELGIALPYMEDELEFLVREQLMRKEGNKYVTNFRIISREEQKRWFDESRAVQKPLTEKICELIDTYMSYDGSAVNAGFVGRENAKWALLVRAFDELRGMSGVVDDQDYPQRPDGGKWMVTGFESTNWDEPYFVGQHGYISYDANEVKDDIYFGQFKFSYKNIRNKTPEHLNYTEARNLWLVCSGRTAECDKEYIEKLIEYGYLKKEDGKILPNVVILDYRMKKPCGNELNVKLSELKDEICDLFRGAPHIERGYVVEQALADGWLRYGDDTVRTIGAFIYLN